MAQIITWNKDDEHIIATDPDGVIHDFTRYYRNVVIWKFPDNYNIVIGDAEPAMAEIRDENDNLLEYIADIQKDNTYHYLNVVEPPSEYKDYRWCYTTDDGWTLKPEDTVPKE